MKRKHYDKYKQIFEYLSAPALSEHAESTVVFGRKDPLVAKSLGNLVIPGLVETAVISGGIGKDSGDIAELGYRSEAHYLSEVLFRDSEARGYAKKLPVVLLDEAATNGGENARNATTILQETGADMSSLTAVAHATSARRLAATLEFESEKIVGYRPKVYVQPSSYEFSPSNPSDQLEARAELLRIADWPAKGWLHEQDDAPENLIDFARDIDTSR